MFFFVTIDGFLVFEALVKHPLAQRTNGETDYAFELEFATREGASFAFLQVG